MKAIYRNSLRSKELIREATIELLNKKHIRDITVVEIVNKANINRGTFYNHYDNPVQVLEEMEHELIEHLYSALKKINNQADIDDLIDSVMLYFEENNDSYKKIIDSIPNSVISSIKSALIIKIKEINNKVPDITLHLLVNAISGLLLGFLRGEIEFSYAQASKEIKDFVKIVATIYNR